MNPDRIVVDTWDPAYGVSFAVDDDIAAPDVDLDVEVPAASWQPVPAPPLPPVRDVLFVDGVQRVDARVTLLDGGVAVAGMAGSFAAGTVRHAPGRAVVERVAVRRGLFTRASDVTLRCGTAVVYRPYPAPDTAAESLVRAMTEQMRALEWVLADEAAAELVVIDGPLSGGQPPPGAVGLVKTHRRMYLPDAAQQMVARLRPGARSPVFLTVTRFSRFSWYLRLPGRASHPWAGIVRCEVSGDLPLSSVRERAAATQATLPVFASAPHRDPRAPQNLTPVGELERQLRHRLGDAALLERMLRRTCASWRG